MFFKVNAPLMKWSKEPSDAAASLGDRVPKEALLEKIGENDDGSWLHLQRTITVGTTPHTGWFKASDVHQVDTPEDQRLKMDKWAFLKTCVRAELAVNALKATAPCYINADYLVASMNPKSRTWATRRRRPMQPVPSRSPASAGPP